MNAPVSSPVLPPPPVVVQELTKLLDQWGLETFMWQYAAVATMIHERLHDRAAKAKKREGFGDFDRLNQAVECAEVAVEHLTKLAATLNYNTKLDSPIDYTAQVSATMAALVNQVGGVDPLLKVLAEVYEADGGQNPRMLGTAEVLREAASVIESVWTK